MATLANFPMVNQETPITGDGKPSNNGPMDCVAASLCAACMWLNGIAQVGGDYTPDSFKDAATSESYTGGTAAASYVAYCARLGIRLYPVNGIPGQLVIDAHQQLQAGHPVVFTISDPWVDTSLPEYRGWSHVCVFIGEDTQGLTSFDPYSVRTYYKADATWTDLLLFNQLWILERSAEVASTIDLTNPEVSRYFEVTTSPTAWRCRSNGKIMQDGILAAYSAYGNSALCGLTYLGLPLSNEIPLAGIPGGVKQYFERGTLIYDPEHKNDNPPGSGAVYAAHLYTGPAQDPRVSQLAPLQSQLAQLEAQIAAAQAGNPQAVAALQARISKAIADLS
jgi:hypothetical protein